MLATGASDIQDVDRAINAIKKHTDQIVLMQCNTNYTASKENFKYINLNVLKTYRKTYPGVLLGLSDHTPGHSTVLGAIALGARVVEKHFTDDNNREGPDHKFAMNPATWREMIDRANELDSALGDGIKRIEENEKQTVLVQRRGLRYQRNIEKGERLDAGDMMPLRPMSPEGVPPYLREMLIGKQLKVDVCADDAVKLGDIAE